MSLIEKKVNRRRFFRSFLAEATSLFDEMRGVRQRKLSEIFNFPDKVIAKIQPAILAEYNLIVEPTAIKARHLEKGTEVNLFEASEVIEFILARFGGTVSIENTAQEVANHFQIDIENARREVNNVFFKLIQHRICIPANEIEELE